MMSDNSRDFGGIPAESLMDMRDDEAEMVDLLPDWPSDDSNDSPRNRRRDPHRAVRQSSMRSRPPQVVLPSFSQDSAEAVIGAAASQAVSGDESSLFAVCPEEMSQVPAEWLMDSMDDSINNPSLSSRSSAVSAIPSTLERGGGKVLAEVVLSSDGSVDENDENPKPTVDENREQSSSAISNDHRYCYDNLDCFFNDLPGNYRTFTYADRAGVVEDGLDGYRGNQKGVQDVEDDDCVVIEQPTKQHRLGAVSRPLVRAEEVIVIDEESNEHSGQSGSEQLRGDGLTNLIIDAGASGDILEGLQLSEKTCVRDLLATIPNDVKRRLVRKCATEEESVGTLVREMLRWKKDHLSEGAIPDYSSASVKRRSGKRKRHAIEKAKELVLCEPVETEETASEESLEPAVQSCESGECSDFQENNLPPTSPRHYSSSSSLIEAVEVSDGLLSNNDKNDADRVRPKDMEPSQSTAAPKVRPSTLKKWRILTSRGVGMEGIFKNCYQYLMSCLRRYVVEWEPERLMEAIEERFMVGGNALPVASDGLSDCPDEVPTVTNNDISTSSEVACQRKRKRSPASEEAAKVTYQFAQCEVKKLSISDKVHLDALLQLQLERVLWLGGIQLVHARASAPSRFSNAEACWEAAVRTLVMGRPKLAEEELGGFEGVDWWAVEVSSLLKILKAEENSSGPSGECENFDRDSPFFEDWDEEHLKQESIMRRKARALNILNGMFCARNKRYEFATDEEKKQLRERARKLEAILRVYRLIKIVSKAIGEKIKKQILKEKASRREAARERMRAKKLCFRKEFLPGAEKNLTPASTTKNSADEAVNLASLENEATNLGSLENSPATDENEESSCARTSCFANYVSASRATSEGESCLLTSEAGDHGNEREDDLQTGTFPQGNFASAFSPSLFVCVKDGMIWKSVKSDDWTLYGGHTKTASATPEKETICVKSEFDL